MLRDWDTNDYANCPKCKMQRTEKGHDPCIANLPGVKYACCGHGVKPGYIYFENGTVIRFLTTRIEYVNVDSPYGEDKATSVNFDMRNFGNQREK